MAQAMNMSVKELFKTMEAGQLDPMTALPKLAELMRSMSAPAMAEFQKSLPYMQGVALENRQQYLRQFNDAGGTSGLTRFWRVWGQIIGDTLPTAEKLGKAFEVMSYKLSALLLIPTELMRWANGENDIRNFWQKYFGDFTDTSFITIISRDMKELWENMKLMGSAVYDLASSFGTSLLPTIEKLITFLSGSLVTISGVFSRILSGDFSGAVDYFKDRQLESAARAKVTADYNEAGLDTTSQAFERDVEAEVNSRKATEAATGKKKGFWENKNEELTNFNRDVETLGIKTHSGLVNWILQWGKEHQSFPRRSQEDLETKINNLNDDWFNIPSNDPNQMRMNQGSKNLDQKIENHISLNINAMGTTTELAQQIERQTIRAIDEYMGNMLSEINNTISYAIG